MSGQQGPTPDVVPHLVPGDGNLRPKQGPPEAHLRESWIVWRTRRGNWNFPEEGNLMTGAQGEGEETPGPREGSSGTTALHLPLAACLPDVALNVLHAYSLTPVWEVPQRTYFTDEESEM